MLQHGLRYFKDLKNVYKVGIRQVEGSKKMFLSKTSLTV